MRLLEILTSEKEMTVGDLFYRSGLPADRFRFWVNELESRDVIEVTRRNKEEFVALKGNLTH
jgi:predicted transcriptional regulator